MISCFKHLVLTNLFVALQVTNIISFSQMQCYLILLHGDTDHAEGMAWLETSIWCHFWHGDLRGEIWNQLSTNLPWFEVHVDLIGPWESKSQGISAKFWAMMIVALVTNLIEIARVTSTKSAKNTCTFKNTGLSQYPKLDKVVADNGLEFSGNEW